MNDKYLPITLNNLSIPKKWFNLPVFDGDQCSDVGWMLLDLIDYYNTLIDKYQQTKDERYNCLIQQLFSNIALKG